MGYVERVLAPGETIAYRARLHWIIYLLGLVLVAAAVGLALAAVALTGESLRVGLMFAALLALFLGLFQIVRTWITAANTEIVVTSRRIIHKTGFLSRNTLEMGLDKVASVVVRQGLFGRMLGYGAVTVRGLGAELGPIDHVGDPLALQRETGGTAAPPASA